MHYKFIIVVTFLIFSIDSQCQKKDSLNLSNLFANISIPTIPIEKLKELTNSKNDSLYILLFGTPSWCPPCKLAIDTLQKVVETYNFKMSRIIIVIWQELESQVKKSIKYFEYSRITIEKYFCYSTEYSVFQNIDNMDSIPKMLIYKNGKLILIIDDAKDFMLGRDDIARKIRDSNNK